MTSSLQPLVPSPAAPPAAPPAAGAALPSAVTARVTRLPAPAPAAPPAPGSASAGGLLRLLRSGRARSRSDLAALTGASRSSVSARVEQLVAAGLVRELGPGGSTGGRPPKLLAFHPGAGCVLAVDLGVTGVDVAVTDLGGRPLALRREAVRVADGPDAVLAIVDALARDALEEVGRAPSDVCGVGMGVPGPVELATGRPVHPPVMPGWHDHDVPAAFAAYDCPVVVDNDVNVLAAGELDDGGPRDFLVVKVGSGIGCGIVVDGAVYRGSAGSAGDIGHIHVPDSRRVLCGCGNENCLEALAGGAALLAEARALGLPVASTREVVALALESDPRALGLVREAGRRIGDVLATLVNFFNPERIVVAGTVALAGNALLAGVREAVYRRSLPLAASALDITLSAQPDRAGWMGAARLAVDAHLSDERVEALLAVPAGR